MYRRGREGVAKSRDGCGHDVWRDGDSALLDESGREAWLLVFLEVAVFFLLRRTVAVVLARMKGIGRVQEGGKTGCGGGAGGVNRGVTVGGRVLAFPGISVKNQFRLALRPPAASPRAAGREVRRGGAAAAQLTRLALPAHFLGVAVAAAGTPARARLAPRRLARQRRHQLLQRQISASPLSPWPRPS